MPEIREFVVTQVREVRVTANNVVDACRIADAAFENGQNSGWGVIDGPEGVWGNTAGWVRTIEIYGKERGHGRT